MRRRVDFKEPGATGFQGSSRMYGADQTSFPEGEIAGVYISPNVEVQGILT